MGYREMIKKVQHYSGFSDDESEDALMVFIELLAKRLEIEERLDLASQLPAELQDTVVAIEDDGSDGNDVSMVDIIEQIAEEQHIDESHAKKQIMAAWQALKDAISKGEVEDIRAQLPKDMAAQLS